MKTNIGLNDEARFEIGQMLNLLLADEYVLAVTTRDYHWNVTGRDFPGLHRQFDEHYVEVAANIDAVAERARAIGINARGNWGELTRTARSQATPGTGLCAEHMLAQLLRLHEGLAAQLRLDSAVCTDRYKDFGTADFLSGLLSRHETAAWMLRAQLETEEAETS